MPYTPRINLSALVKKGVLNEDHFFQLLSEQNNYIDVKTVKDFYMGLVRVLTAELRKNGVVRLPHIGDFALVLQKDRIGWAGKFHGIITGKYMIKFYAKDTWRKYFTKLSEKSGLEGKLDSREKVLGQTLE